MKLWNSSVRKLVQARRTYKAQSNIKGNGIVHIMFKTKNKHLDCWILYSRERAFSSFAKTLGYNLHVLATKICPFNLKTVQ